MLRRWEGHGPREGDETRGFPMEEKAPAFFLDASTLPTHQGTWRECRALGKRGPQNSR